jgi:hypothetical protein
MMYNKIIVLSFLTLVVSFAGNTYANEWTQGIHLALDPNDSDNLFMNGDNWLQGLPTSTRTDGGQWATMSVLDPAVTLCIIQAGDVASAGAVQAGAFGAVNTFKMTGGSLTCNWVDAGRGGSNNPGHAGSFGTVLIEGGNLNLQGLVIPEQFANPPVVQGYCLMTGGTIEADFVNIGKNQGVGHFDFHGGTINLTGNLSFHDVWATESSPTEDGSMDITTGVMTSDVDMTALVQGYIDQGWITFYGAAPIDERYYILDFDITNPGETTLAAVDPGTIVFENAWGPSPGNGDLVDITTGNVTLDWNSGDPVGTYKHDVHFGTNPAPGFVVQLNESDTDHVAAAGQLDTTYYWEITEDNGGTFEGPVWRFTTQDFLTVDDFDPNEGVVAWTDTGSVVTSEVNEGTTMRINCGSGQSGSTFRTPPQSDWDQQDLKAIRLSFLGDPANDPGATLSMTVNNSTVAYDNSGGELQTAEWTTWFVAYSEFALLGADLSNVTNFEISVASGAADLQLDIEDIELTLLQCLENPATDNSGDCVVNLFDMATLSNEWMSNGLALP